MKQRQTKHLFSRTCWVVQEWSTIVEETQCSISKPTKKDNLIKNYME